MIKRIALSAVPLAAAAALTMGGIAHAAPAPAAPAPAPSANSDGTIGYQAVQNLGGATYFTHIIGQFGLGDPQYGLTNPTLKSNPLLSVFLNNLPSNHTWENFNNGFGFTVDATRVGLCGGENHFDAATTVQSMMIPVSNHTYDVVAIEGQATPGGEGCLNSALPAGKISLLLKNVPSRDTTQLEVLYDGHHAHNGVPAGFATIVANDLSRPNLAVANTPGRIFPVAGNELYEADAGIIGADGAPTAGLPGDVLPDSSGPNLVVKLAHVALNGNDLNTGDEVHGTLQSDAAWVAVPVVDHARGLVAGAVSVFKSDHFSVYSAPGALDYQELANPGNGNN
ncbi:MAG TPA: hypothetical protein VGD91_08070 [Trebonia sp.]